MDEELVSPDGSVIVLESAWHVALILNQLLFFVKTFGVTTSFVLSFSRIRM